MAEDRKASIRYKVLDECFSNREKDFFMKDLIEADRMQRQDFCSRVEFDFDP